MESGLDWKEKILLIEQENSYILITKNGPIYFKSFLNLRNTIDFETDEINLNEFIFNIFPFFRSIDLEGKNEYLKNTILINYLKDYLDGKNKKTYKNDFKLIFKSFLDKCETIELFLIFINALLPNMEDLTVSDLIIDETVYNEKDVNDFIDLLYDSKNMYFSITKTFKGLKNIETVILPNDVYNIFEDDNYIYFSGYRRTKKVKGHNKYTYRFYKTEKNKFNQEFIKYFKEQKTISKTILKLLIYSDNHGSIEKNMFHRWQLINPTNEKVREITAPEEDLKDLLKELLIPLDKAFETRLKHKESNQFAYIPNRNIKENARIHKDNKFVIKFDLKLYFDSCKWDYVKKYLNIWELDPEHEEILKAVIISSETGGLFLGSPVSGTLANMVIHPVAYKLNNIFNKFNKEDTEQKINFSMYADDLTFSSNIINENFNKTYLTALIENTLKEFKLDGINLNNDKTRVLRNNGRRITGVRINHLDQITLDRRNYDFIKSVIDHLKYNQPISLDKKVLEGKIAYSLFIDESGKWQRLVDKNLKVLKEHNIILPNFIYDKQLSFEEIVSTLDLFDESEEELCQEI